MTERLKLYSLPCVEEHIAPFWESSKLSTLIKRFGTDRAFEVTKNVGYENGKVNFEQISVEFSSLGENGTLSLITNARKGKEPAVSLFVPKNFVGLDLADKEVATMLTLAGYEGPLDLNFEDKDNSVVNNELAIFFAKTRRNLSILLSAYYYVDEQNTQIL